MPERNDSRPRTLKLPMMFRRTQAHWTRRDMAPVLSQAEILEITRLLEQGKALPEKYREVLFVDRQFRSEEHTAGSREQSGLAAAPFAPPTVQSSEPNTTAFSITGFCKFLLGDPQTQLTINKYVGMIVSKERGELPPLAIKCTGEIIEIVPQILNQCGNNDYVLRWRNPKLPDDIKRQLYRVIHERLIHREFEVRREREAKEREREAKDQGRRAGSR